MSIERAVGEQQRVIDFDPSLTLFHQWNFAATLYRQQILRMFIRR